MNKVYNKMSLWLWLLTVVFIFRVLGQLTVLWFDITFLPSFDQWSSGALAYPVLLGVQCLIIFIMLLVSYRISKRRLQPSRKIGVSLQIVGWIYFSVMFVRLLIGITEAVDITWFQRPIPSFFHIVLASYILLVAHYHQSASIKDE